MVQEPRQLIQKVVETDKVHATIIVLAWFLVFGLKFAFTLWPETEVLEQFFKFDDQSMTRPAYVDYFADCWTYIILSFLMFIFMPKQREYLFYITLLWFGYFIEFFFMYNQPVTKFYGLPIGYSMLTACAFAFLLIRSIVKIFKS